MVRLHDRHVTSPDFEFLIEESFTITGRGVGVFGQWRSGDIRTGHRGYLHPPDLVLLIGRISVEYALLPGGDEQVGLLLHGLTIDQVPAGSIVRSRP